MFAAFGKFWSTLFTLLDTVERASNSLNEIAQIAQIAEDEARGLKDQMKIERDDKHAKLVQLLRAA